MPVRTRQIFSEPGLEAEDYRVQLARAMQQRAMTPNLPPVGGPVQVAYSPWQGLTDLATALVSSRNVRKSEDAYQRAQQAQMAAKQAAQQEALQAMIGRQVQPPVDGVGPMPEGGRVTPSYEETIAASQGAINAGVAPEIAKALIELRKPKEPQEAYTLPPGARRFGPDNQPVAENPAANGATSPASIQEWQAFRQMSPQDQARYLQMKRAPERPWFGVIGGGVGAIPVQNGAPGAPQMYTTPDQEREAAALAAAEKAAAETVAKNKADAQADLQPAMDSSQQMLDALDNFGKAEGFNAVYGMSSPMRYVPGTKAADANAMLEQVGGKAFLQAFQSLRGGGQITEKEGAKATAAITRLVNTSQSEESAREALKELRDIVELGMTRARQRAGGAPLAPEKPAAPAKSGPTVSNW